MYASYCMLAVKYIPTFGSHCGEGFCQVTISVTVAELVVYCSQTVTVEVDDEKAVKRCSVISSQLPTSVVVTCRMLDCDTISQAKAKALDALYANNPFSCRPSLDDVELCE